MDHVSEKRYPVNPNDYKLYEEVGEGVSANVYRALCVPFNEIVAIKVLDLEKCNNDLDGIRREVQTMILIDHPNVLRAHCSFTVDLTLWVVMPYMAGGSCLHIMKCSHPEGFDEPVIATLLREVLKALVYLHGHGHIHRDIKAGNILIDANGAVKLADFGVSAYMFDAGDRQRSRNTFVGTPCWMAPEVMQQLHGYDFKADIWSFGITALELAHGHAPLSKYPPMKVLLMTLQNAPPGLDYERDKRFSKSFKEMVATCLVKDPKKRPSSEKLLKHHFFKHSHSNDYLARTILDGLPPLGERFRIQKEKEADIHLNNKMHGDNEHLSQQVYIHGISGWNFDLEELKTQAALIQYIDETKNSKMNHKFKDGCDDVNFTPEVLSPAKMNHADAVAGPLDLPDLDGSFASSFPTRPLQALKGYFDACEEDANSSSPDWKNGIEASSEISFPSQVKDRETSLNNGKIPESSFYVPKSISLSGQPNFLSGPLLPEHALSSSRKSSRNAERDDLMQAKFQSERNHSGPLLCRQLRDANATKNEEASEGKVVQQKGRFKVTSADAGPKGNPSSSDIFNPVSGTPKDPTVFAASILPSLQYMLQQNAMQREQLIKVLKYVEQTSGCHAEPADIGCSDLSQPSPTSSRERELQSYVIHLQENLGNLADEVRKLRMQNAQIERQLSAISNREEMGERRPSQSAVK